MGIFCRKKRVHILKIRKINIHDSFQCLDGIHILIASRIVYNRNRKSLPSRLFYRPDDMRHILPRCNQIDIVRPLFLQFQKNLHQPFRCDFFSRSPLCNRLILTKHTVHGTAGKKDGSRTFCSTDTRFFPEMQSRPCYL